MRLLTLAAILCLATPAFGPKAWAQTALPLNIGGRVAPAPDGTYEFGWPGVYFEGRFNGPSVEVVVDTGAEHLAVSVDGARKAELTKAGELHLLLDRLGPGEHVVRLDKLTESQTGSARFEGFFVGPREAALPAPAVRAGSSSSAIPTRSATACARPAALAPKARSTT